MANRSTQSRPAKDRAATLVRARAAAAAAASALTVGADWDDPAYWSRGTTGKPTRDAHRRSPAIDAIRANREQLQKMYDQLSETGFSLAQIKERNAGLWQSQWGRREDAPPDRGDQRSIGDLMSSGRDVEAVRELAATQRRHYGQDEGFGWSPRNGLAEPVEGEPKVGDPSETPWRQDHPAGIAIKPQPPIPIASYLSGATIDQHYAALRDYAARVRAFWASGWPR